MAQTAEADQLPPLPTLDELADDLWLIVRSGFADLQPDKLAALRRLGIARATPSDAGVSRYDVQRCLNIACSTTQHPDVAHQLRTLLGATDSTRNLTLEGRLEALGLLMSTRKGRDGSISAKTIRNSGRARALIEDLAAILRDQEVAFRATGKRYEAPEGNVDLFGRRAYFAVERERTLGYHWRRYHRHLFAPNQHWAWRDQTTITFESLRSGPLIFQLDYPAPHRYKDAVVRVTAPTWMYPEDEDNRCTRLKVETLPATGDMWLDWPWWRAYYDIASDQDKGTLYEVQIDRILPSRVRHVQGGKSASTTATVTPLFDEMADLSLSFEAPQTLPSIEARAVVSSSVGPHSRIDYDEGLDVEVDRSIRPPRVHGGFASPVPPSAGRTYALSIVVYYNE